MWWQATLAIPAVSILLAGLDGLPGQPDPSARGHRVFVALRPARDFTRTVGAAPGEFVLTSREFKTGIDANEIIVSWNVAAGDGDGVTVEARAHCGERFTKYYTLALWSRDAAAFPRESVKGQEDSDGDVHTDTLALKQPADKLQVRITLRPASGGPEPRLKFLGVSFAQTDFDPPMDPVKDQPAAGEVVVPSRTQLGWPDAAGWCSPTSTSMVLAYWSDKLRRKELDSPVPDTARAVYDRVFDGTGNWPFNTAFAGSFVGMRAYVTRFSKLDELQQWVSAGIPPIVSLSYDLLKGEETAEDPGHLMVCDGFTESGEIVLNDPAHRPDRGEHARRVFPLAEFIRAWKNSHCTVYLIYPSRARVPHDTMGHWAR